jgi:hypothetical protein
MGETAPDTGQHQIPRESIAISLQRRKFEDANAFDFEIAMRWDGIQKKVSCIKAQFHAP